ncbi:hypothetical protein Pmar_PMAR009072 [Perkinsus marinus ATCC 50983]|uniref:Uncharacterized protein n=1 Tax=Perkinsus marinus (strain ATCC 50983 / TXsc) TaxID=423536 RepID=C5LQ44_PERM5|nr:hypothetical protein Pmar_PMAR009072 [Perkinsus marinus ATCC 50983]EER01152.1 hypothetical protein Pmar_PMAR009072 [Perkinsus marinus ATCC 50983]|eukprot:XP_002768434.1 hypothetical protein Pmar_PMAR009072 [Perkinsus marinus ATCC 50983]
MATTSLCHEERMAAAAAPDKSCIVQHPTVSSPQWLVIRLTPEVLTDDSGEAARGGKFQINLSWREKTPIRKVFTFLRRSITVTTPLSQQLYLRWDGHIMATEADHHHTEMALQDTLAGEFAKSVATPVGKAAASPGIKDSAVICMISYGYMNKLSNAAVQTTEYTTRSVATGGVISASTLNKSTMTSGRKRSNVGVQVEGDSHEVSAQSQSVDEHSSNKKAGGKRKKSDVDSVQADEVLHKRKRRSKKANTKGVKKRHKPEESGSDPIVELPEAGHGATEEPVEDHEINACRGPSSCKGQSGSLTPARQEGIPTSDQSCGQLSSDDGVTTRKDGLIDTTPGPSYATTEQETVDVNSHEQAVLQEKKGVTMLRTSIALSSLIAHIPEDDPIEVDYGDDTSTLGLGGDGDDDDSASIIFEEPPDGDLFDDVVDDDALEEEHEEGGLKRPPVILRPKPRPLSLSSIISDCMPLEDSDRAKMEGSPPISASDLEGVVITPSEHPPLSTHATPNDCPDNGTPPPGKGEATKSTQAKHHHKHRRRKRRDEHAEESPEATHEFCCMEDSHERLHPRSDVSAGLMNDSYSKTGRKYLRVRASVLCKEMNTSCQ